VELYLDSPIRLHGVVFSLKKAQGQLYLLFYYGSYSQILYRDNKSLPLVFILLLKISEYKPGTGYSDRSFFFLKF